MTLIYDNSINFLDIEIYKGLQFEDSGKLDTKVFFKPTDTHQLLHQASFHPHHTFYGIVKSQVLRFFRICNNKFDFNIACQILFNVLTTRGYSKRNLRRIKSEVSCGYPISKLVCNIGFTSPCNGPRCQKCPLLLSGTSFDINNILLTISGQLNCNSTCVIYFIKCELCNMFYIGETKNAFRLRINQHLSSINLDLNLPVAKHFHSRFHSIEAHFRIAPICREENDKYRKFKESKLIKKFKTEAPIGLNERVDDTLRQNSILPLIVPYSQGNARFGLLAKEAARKFQITKSKIVTAFTKHKNLNSILCPKVIRPK